MTMASGATGFQFGAGDVLGFASDFSPMVSPGRHYQFEYTRTAPTNPGATSLVGDWTLASLYFDPS
jgi:hypothetical protein